MYTVPPTEKLYWFYYLPQCFMFNHVIIYICFVLYDMHTLILSSLSGRNEWFCFHTFRMNRFLAYLHLMYYINGRNSLCLGWVECFQSSWVIQKRKMSYSLRLIIVIAAILYKTLLLNISYYVVIVLTVCCRYWEFKFISISLNSQPHPIKI